MPEILSQSEIDDLLSSLLSGGTEGDSAEKTPDRKIKEYDFKNPKKIAKEQLKMINSIFEHFSRHLSSYFSGILREYCEVNVISMDEQPYFEYNNSLPDSVLIGALEVKPIEGLMLIDFSNSISFTLIERLLGGNGEGSVPERDFTEIETTLMTKVFRQIAVYMQEAWSGVIGAEASLKQVETNARLVQSMPMEEAVVLIIMEVTIGSVSGMINFCIPCINLETILDQLSQNRMNGKRSVDNVKEDTNRETMLSNIKRTPLVGNAVFGGTMLTLRDVMKLQVGDVIKIDQDIQSEVKINIGGRTWFYGVPGVRRNKKAIKVSRVLE